MWLSSPLTQWPQAECVKHGHTFVNVLCRTGASIRGVEVVGAVRVEQRTGVATWRGLCVCVTCVPAVAVVMRREGGAAAIYHIHGLWGERKEEGVISHVLMCVDPEMVL